MVCCNFIEYKVKMSDFTCFLVIAIKRQWCLACILKFEGFPKTIDFPLCRDLQYLNWSLNHQTILIFAMVSQDPERRL